MVSSPFMYFFGYKKHGVRPDDTCSYVYKNHKKWRKIKLC